MITLSNTPLPCRPPGPCSNASCSTRWTERSDPFLEKYTRDDGGTDLGRPAGSAATAPTTSTRASTTGRCCTCWAAATTCCRCSTGSGTPSRGNSRAWACCTRSTSCGYDQFHQGESYIYFYFLCLADPTNPKLIERARRFAGFYLNEDPEAPNYDPEHRSSARRTTAAAARAGASRRRRASYGWTHGHVTLRPAL